MTAISPARFGEFFEAVYGYPPFPWQSEMARRVVETTAAPWPSVLDLPTAAGKTSCIDIAVFALACQADLPPDKRTAARRIFFIVDRRVIVSEAFSHGMSLAERLRDASDGILKEVADKLRLVSCDVDSDPLSCFQLRGGMYRDDVWAKSPLQPSIVVSTIDQYASRLLFRGYGSSHGMRPIHAGLAANDALVILDEAHCSEPFRQTIESIRRYRLWNDGTQDLPRPPFHLMLMSATPGGVSGSKFGLGPADVRHPVLSRRIEARKPVRLVKAIRRRGHSVTDALAAQAEEEAVKLVGNERRNIGVIVNRIATARKVHRLLVDKGYDSSLLIGRMRPIDRNRIEQELTDRLKTRIATEEGEESDGTDPRFVVATQCIEVGADLDFDGLVTECASMPSLRQRFGRLNRGGRDIDARGVVVVRPDQQDPTKKAAEDPIYGMALAETWRWLTQHAIDEVVDFGYGALDQALTSDGDGLAELTQEAPDAPVMLPAYVDAWSQTSPEPSPDPDISIFLHGLQRGTPEVQLCWRSDLENELVENAKIDMLSLCPPSSLECMSAPLHTVERWLSSDDRREDEEDSDIEGSSILVERNSSNARQRFKRRVLCWRGAAASFEVAHASGLRRLRPGDTLVIPAELGGWDAFGHLPSGGTASIDVADETNLQARAKIILRVTAAVVRGWIPSDDPLKDKNSAFDALMHIAESPFRWEDTELAEKIVEAIGMLRNNSEAVPEWLSDAAGEISRSIYANEGGLQVTDKRLKITPHPSGKGIVFQSSRLLPKYKTQASSLVVVDDDDEYSSTVEVSMDDHLDGVGEWAVRFGNGVGLPPSLLNDLRLAARYHDIGKSDPRFQYMLHGGNKWAAHASGKLLAKSGGMPVDRAEKRRAAREVGYPRNWRHELLSVRLVEDDAELLAAANDPDLVLHLVGSHHGFCRPFAPVVRDAAPESVDALIQGRHFRRGAIPTELERLDSGVADRYWRLVRRYGWWGLAWLESILRLADHRRSEEEQERKETY